MQRAIECKCQEHFEARTDADLLDMLRHHAEEEHPEWSQADIKVFLARSVHDQVPEGAQA
jgi:hypothetical protein